MALSQGIISFDKKLTMFSDKEGGFDASIQSLDKINQFLG
jgi:hypothetical protein